MRNAYVSDPKSCGLHPQAGWTSLRGVVGNRSSRKIQSPNPTAHDLEYVDYGTLVRAVDEDGRISNLPLIELTGGAEKPFFARLGGRLARERLAELGLRLATVDEWEAMASIAFHIDPFVLPTPQMIGAAGIFRRRGATPEEQTALDHEYELRVQNEVRIPNMMSREWCCLHDAEVGRRLAGWDGSKPVANAGKGWADPPNTIVGWWL